MPGIDFTGYESIRESGWHRKLHIFQVPFYYIEYGIAQIGAMQIWRNSLQDQQAATQAYRRALALGGTKTLPELFKAADIEFRFDAGLVAELVALVEDKITQLEALLR
jgi:oligoendopeptidase F